MRVLLDEHLPELQGHDVHTVVGRGWAGVKNSDLLRRMGGDYDVFVTMNRGIEFHLLLALPYVATLLILCGIAGRVRAPEALGKS